MTYVDGEDFERLLRAHLLRISRLARMLGEIEEKMDSLYADARRLQERAPRTDDGQAAPQRASDLERLLALQAVRGVSNVEWHLIAPGYTGVSFDAGPIIKLTFFQATLLKLLASAPADEEDGLAAWLGVEETRIAIGQKRGIKISRQSIRQGVLELRKALARHGANPYLIQTRRGRGYRLAFRRPVNESDTPNIAAGWR